MNENNDWDEIEKYKQEEDARIINTFGIDIRESFNKHTDKNYIMKHRRIKFHIIIVIILLVTILTPKNKRTKLVLLFFTFYF